MNMESPEIGSIKEQGDIPTARLRIMETTDLHMQILDYDYFSDRAEVSTGLINLAAIIEDLRAEDGVTSLLFDNGDFIQGNPLADYVASHGIESGAHPMITALNTLAYDAVTLGNHEFNYGLEFLQRILKDAQFPVTCANITHLTGDALAEPFLILDRTLQCDDGVVRPVKIGVTGFLPPQITEWDKAALLDQISTEDIIAAATDIVPQIKAAGADIVVALCHSGIGATEHSQRMENAAVPLAAIPDIDVVLTGHTHDVFPGNSVMASAAIDPLAGTLHGKPAVMAGFYGSLLGVVDMRLAWRHGGWQMQGAQARLQSGTKPKTQSPIQQQLSAQVGDAHAATLRHIRQPIAQTNVPIHSYFANIGPDMAQHLLAKAQKKFITEAMVGLGHDDLPVLAATAPFRVGGRTGPAHYIDIPPGPLTLRDAAAIYPFANVLCAVRCTGRQLRLWLERAASHFATITPGQHDQSLFNPHSAPYNSDTIYGLRYRFDLSQPARFTPNGVLSDGNAARVTHLSCGDRPVGDDDCFIVATNSYRTNGGGGFGSTDPADILFTSTETTRDILINHLRHSGPDALTCRHPVQFTNHPDTSAVFQSAPAAQRYLTEGISHIGPGTDGFDRYRLTF